MGQVAHTVYTVKHTQCKVVRSVVCVHSAVSIMSDRTEHPRTVCTEEYVIYTYVGTYHGKYGVACSIYSTVQHTAVYLL